ncbi:MAG TPA: carboxypeptidase regulatory-like domain-containing protein [Anaerolineales bacterium]|nr:carboxypeptidase regulatory-like domain-containing protein [Anaerolineales bacterium]
MKFKRLFQIVVLLTLVFSSFGSGAHVRASSNSPSSPLDAIVINRNLNVWDATYIGFVSASIFEKWSLELTEAHDFVVTVSPITGDLVPLLTLQDANGNEIAHGTGSLTTSQPAGSYFIQTQPESGSGFYVLTLRQVVNTQPSVSTSVNPANLNVGETASATVSLNNVPAEGYTSAEFTCTYNASLLEVSNIVVAGLFGADPASAINGPQNGSFIVAIAGSNGDKATTSGTAFTFSVKALQAGQSTVECTARVSKGDNVLTSISSTGTDVTVTGTAATPTFTPTPDTSPSATVTSTPDGSATPTSTPDGSATATSTPDGSATVTSTPDGSATATSTPDGSATATSTPDGSATATSTPAESPTPTFTFTPEASPTPTFTFTPEVSPTPQPAGSLTGQVLASKPVTVSLFDSNNSVVASVTANPDGTFSLTAPAGTYNILAAASGFLSAQGSVTLTSGGADTISTISLLAGDIDNNNVIDQLDAMTIGMNYNTAVPAAADLNNDGTINVLDLELLAKNYRATGPTDWQ